MEDSLNVWITSIRVKEFSQFCDIFFWETHFSRYFREFGLIALSGHRMMVVLITSK